MWGGAPGNSFPDLVLRKGRRIQYLKKHIPELIFFQQPENPIADFISI